MIDELNAPVLAGAKGQSPRETVTLMRDRYLEKAASLSADAERFTARLANGEALDRESKRLLTEKAAQAGAEAERRAACAAALDAALAGKLR